MRIVIVDDCEAVLGLVRDMVMEIPDFQAIGAYTAPLEALEGIKKLQPDLIITDYQMPDMSGGKLLAKAGIPGIIMTADADAVLEEHKQWPILSKPFKAEQLYDLLNAVKSKTKEVT